MPTPSSRDNWERLVAAVIKREQIWQLCHQDSITTVDSDFSQNLSLRTFSPSPPHQLPLTNDSNVKERRESQPPLGWAIRLRIALGVARGLAYLHHKCIRGIIHRDVKAANILLDEDFEAFVADFTLAKFVDCYDKDGIKGTIGHIAPEYVSTGECSLKTDVYGYGVFLLELITGQRTFDLARLASDGDMTYLDWVKRLCEEKNFEAIVDRYLGGNIVREEVDKLLRISLICTQTDPEGRPTMPAVVRMLEVGYGFIKTWELSLNVNYEDEKYSSKLHPSSEGIVNEDSSFNM